MSAATEPGLPQDPADFSRRPRLRIWTAPLFGLLGVLAGAGLALYAPGLLPKPPAAPAPAVAAPPPAVVAAQPAPPPPAATSGEVERLNAKIAALESQGLKSSAAAQSALAAAELIDVSRSSRPFVGELARLRAASPELPELAALARVAEVGAPSRAALAVSFPAYAARAAVAARRPGEDSKFEERFIYLFSRLVAVRRIGDTNSATPDAALARADHALADGDVAAALTALKALPPKAQDAVAPWIAQAERRAEIDRQISALRRRAVAGLSAQPELAP